MSFSKRHAKIEKFMRNGRGKLRVVERLTDDG
jgi:hypothetical protein